MGVVGGGDEIDVVGALVDELEAEGTQMLRRDGLAPTLVADGLILAEHTLQGAAGEKEGAAAPSAGDGRLLPLMQCRPCSHRQGGHPAQATAFCICAQGVAVAGTEITNHDSPPLHWAK